MSGRCDEISQCLDKTDEDDCNLITINKEVYNKAYPPRVEGGLLDVKADIIVVAIRNIKELDMTFNSKITLSMEWSDERVKFSNLKTKDLTNLLGYKKSTEIWIPQLVFNNTRNNFLVLHDPKASLFINKRGNPKMAPHSSVNEDFHYKGSENRFVYKMDYDMTYGCHYDLFKYPFDTQKCQIEVRRV